MRWIMTLLLIGLVAAGGLLLFSREARQFAGLERAADSQSAAAAKLAEASQANAILSISRSYHGDDFVLTIDERGEWSLPGNWPARQHDAGELAKQLRELKSRFRPIAINKDTDLSPYGLADADKPAVIKVETKGKTLTLKFGQGKLKDGESAFGRPTFLRVDDEPELLRFGPDLFAAVTKPVDAYRRKQIFPEVVRLEVPSGRPRDPRNPVIEIGKAIIPSDKIIGVKVDGPDGGASLVRVKPTPKPSVKPESESQPNVTPERLASAWKIAEVAKKPGEFNKLEDRVDPARLRMLLTSVPTVWVEKFHPKMTEAEAGLDKPVRSVEVTLAGGNKRVLKIGRLSRSERVKEPEPPPMEEAPPRQPRMIDYYYARLGDSPLIFEVAGRDFDELFGTAAAPLADALRDPAVVRFEREQVNAITIAVPGKPLIKLEKVKAEPGTGKKADRWMINGAEAQAVEVSQLIDAIKDLNADAKNRFDNPGEAKLKSLGLTAARTTVTLSMVDDAGKSVERVLEIGEAGPQRGVRVAGSGRINAIEKASFESLEREARAYRNRTLFPGDEVKVTAFAVRPPDGKAVAFERIAENQWTMTKPDKLDADAAKAESAAKELAGLAAAEFLPANDGLWASLRQGWLAPAREIELKFADGKTKTIVLGSEVPGKPEQYAKFADGGEPFTISKTMLDAAIANPERMLPLQLWTVDAKKVKSIEIERPGEKPYRFDRDGDQWTLRGPFEAKLPKFEAGPLPGLLRQFRASEFRLFPADLKALELDAPKVKVRFTYETGDGKLQFHTIELGKEENGLQAARIDGGSMVAMLPPGLFTLANQSALSQIDRELGSLPEGKLKSIALESPAGNAMLNAAKKKITDGGMERETSEWVLEGQPFKADEIVAADLAMAAAMPFASEIVEYSAQPDLAKYGLNKPKLTIVATADDGKSLTIKLGNEDAKGGRYIRVNDGPAIGVLRGSPLLEITRGPIDLADRNLLTLKKIEGISRRDGKEILEITSTAGMGEAAPTVWSIVKPESKAADGPWMDSLAMQLANLRAVSIEAVNAKNLRDYSLDQPMFEVTLTAGNEKKTLKIGYETDGGKTGNRYATLDGKTVAVLPGALLDRLLASPRKFQDRSIAKRKETRTVTVAVGPRTVTFENGPRGWQMTKPVTAPAESTALLQVVRSLENLRADDIVEDAPKDLAKYGLDKPLAVWTATDEAGPLVLKLGKADEKGRYYAMIDGRATVFSLSPFFGSQLQAEYRQRSPWPNVLPDQVQAFAVKSEKGTFTLQKQGADWIDLEQPDSVVDAKAAADFAALLAGLKAVRYAADDGADFKLYGLEKPERAVAFAAAGGVKELQIGKEVNGKTYARLPGRGEVFEIDPLAALQLLKTRADFAAKKP